MTKTIHQFTPSMEVGDSVSNGILYVQKMLKKLGFISNIYVSRGDLNINFKKNIHHISEYIEDANQLLFYHHSIGHNYHDKIMKFRDKKVIVYHNITPPHFFKNNKHIQDLCIQGREQLKNSSNCFIASIGDSDYNCKELKSYNYKNVTTLTLLLDLDKQIEYKPNQKLIEKYHDIYNIIFVGRVVQNKVQHQLIDVAYALKRKGVKNFKIHIIGGASEPKYMEFLQQYVKNMDMLVEVTITGKVSDEDLVSYYNIADLYLSISEHEGFGMPLIEAMKYDIPVLAYNAGGTTTTIPKEGLLEKKAPSFVADEIIKLQKDPYFRVDLVKKQKMKLDSFSVKNTTNKLITFLNTLDIDIPKIKIEATKRKLDIQVEGPFDSTYSLAIVNKDIAQVLDAKLYSTEGGGDFEPNLDAVDASVKTLALKELDNIDITIRNLYPPRTNAMRGYHKIIGPYGWEESKFPQQYVEWFNTKLTMVFTMSDYVKNLLQENGVYVPVVTTGLVVEDILKISSKPLSYELPNSFKMLHISSAFARKGIDVLLASFERLDENDEVSLIIKTFPNPHNDVINQLQNLNYKVIKTYEQDVTLYEKNSKQILLINKDISQQQIKWLYENSDVLVAPSYGEGFGLPMAEAMLLELPVITTNYSGQVDFCKDDNSWLVDFDFRYANTHMNLINSFWAVPKITSMVEKITEVKEMLNSNDKVLKGKLANAKELILEKYSSKQIATNIYEAIDNYTKKTTTKKVAWVSSYNTKCGIATYSEFIINNFTQLEVTKFANYSEIVVDAKYEKDVVRCWRDRFDNDNLELIKNILEGGFKSVVINFNFAFFSMDNLAEIIDQLHLNDVKITIIFHSVADVTIEGLEASLSLIKDTLFKVDKLLVHNIDDLNFLKDLGLLNTGLLAHGVKNRVGLKLVQKDKVTNIASYGFLLPHKGILELIDAFAMVEKEFKHIKLMLVNALYPAKVSNDYLALCKQRVKELNLTKKVTFYSEFLDDKESYKLLDKADLLVMPYHHTNESASGAIRYAISTLKPVLCTKQPIFNDVKDIVHFVDGDKTENMADAIKVLLKDKKLLYSKAQKQKLWVEEHDWKMVSQIVENIITNAF